MSTFKHISVSDAKKIIENQSIVVIDIRDPQSYQQEHINGALNINGENIADFVKNADKEKTIICCCYRGHSSQSAAMYLVDQGFKDVYSLDGGYEEWRLSHA